MCPVEHAQHVLVCLGGIMICSTFFFSFLFFCDLIWYGREDVWDLITGTIDSKPEPLRGSALCRSVSHLHRLQGTCCVVYIVLNLQSVFLPQSPVASECVLLNTFLFKIFNIHIVI